jgi:uncharacterized protein
MISLLRIWLLSILFGSLVSPAFAFEEPATDKLQAIPALTGPVVDLTGTLTAEQLQQLSQKLIGLQQQYGAQMQVLLVPTTQPEDAFSYSLRVVEKWQLGSKEKDDGLLLLIAKNDRKSQIQTGYGIEGVIPDIVARSLLMDTLAPHLRNGDFAGGINATVDAAFQRISGEVTAMPKKKYTSRSHNKNNGQPDWMAALIFGAVGIAVFSNMLGGFLASGIGAFGVFLYVWLIVGVSLVMALVLAIAACVMGLFFRFGGAGGGYGGGGGFGGGGWTGGGGGFGGGGSSGSW